MKSKQDKEIEEALKKKIAEGMKPLEALRWVEINLLGVKDPDFPIRYR